MKAYFTNFSNNKSLEDCVFMLPKTYNGLYKLDTIYDGSKVDSKSKEWYYSFEEMKLLKGFYVSNKGTATGSKYKTSKGFINRIKKEI